MAKKSKSVPKPLGYVNNIGAETKDTFKDVVILAKQSYNLIVQIVGLVCALIPVGRKIFSKIKEFKANIKK